MGHGVAADLMPLCPLLDEVRVRLREFAGHKERARARRVELLERRDVGLDLDVEGQEHRTLRGPARRRWPPDRRRGAARPTIQRNRRWSFIPGLGAVPPLADRATRMRTSRAGISGKREIEEHKPGTAGRASSRPRRRRRLAPARRAGSAGRRGRGTRRIGQGHPSPRPGAAAMAKPRMASGAGAYHESSE